VVANVHTQMLLSHMDPCEMVTPGVLATALMTILPPRKVAHQAQQRKLRGVEALLLEEGGLDQAGCLPRYMEP